jgi:mutual gliding-motility protein MglA
VYRGVDEKHLPPSVKDEARDLCGLDGFVFVADSQLERFDANGAAYTALCRDLAYFGRSVDEFPLVLQLNKRDLPLARPAEEVLGSTGIPTSSLAWFETVAKTGAGCREAMEELLRQVARRKHSTRAP